MLYDYSDDTYLSESVDNNCLVKFENQSLEEVNSLNINNEYYKKQLTIYGVFRRIAGSLLEAEGDGIDKKLKYYRDEWNRYYSLAISNQPEKTSAVSAVTFGRS